MPSNKFLNPNLLCVEGNEDKRLFPQLMDFHVVWGDTKNNETPIVDIEVANSVDELLSKNFVRQKIKRNDLQRFGIIFDANHSPSKRWQSLQNACSTFDSIPDLATKIISEGYITATKEGIRFGVWMMPDNSSVGMAETFLVNMAKEKNSPLLNHASGYCRSAKQNHEAPYNDEFHFDKALIHSWLAVQDPPGQQMHAAVMQKILDPKSTYAQSFVDWFCKLYEIKPRAK